MAFGQTVFGQMVFQSNSVSVKWCPVKQPLIKWCFGQKMFGQKFSAKLFFGQVNQSHYFIKFFSTNVTIEQI
jgi:hypothetical protein